VRAERIYAGNYQSGGGLRCWESEEKEYRTGGGGDRRSPPEVLPEGQVKTGGALAIRETGRKKGNRSGTPKKQQARRGMRGRVGERGPLFVGSDGKVARGLPNTCEPVPMGHDHGSLTGQLRG